MPPPKKPKCGRTSLEQFLSEEERLGTLSGSRGLRDSEGNSPIGSVDLDCSDGEVFDHSKQSTKSTDGVESKSYTEHNESLFLKLFRKSHSVDEQKVPGSPDEDMPSPTSSPTMESDGRLGNVKKNQDQIRHSSETKEEKEYPKAGSVSPQNYHKFKMERSLSAKDAVECPRTSPVDSQISNEQGRLIDSLVASALASSAAQSIIYSNRQLLDVAPMTSQPSHLTSYRSTCGMKSYDTEPHDLSKKSERNDKLLNHRLYENLNNTSDAGPASQMFRDWVIQRDGRDTMADRNKHYLENHRHIVGLLAGRREEATRGQSRTPVQVLEKENLVQSVPARYPNGLFHSVGLNGILGNFSRYEQPERESSVESSPINKMEESGCMLSQSNFLPVHSLMQPMPPVSQNPTSTTMDMTDPRDRYHPALMNPHFLADSRRIKSENSHGPNVNKLCQVCNDNASGFHYGVWSCEGCKAFFKRSIQGPVDYVCPATNTCTIDKHRRKSCQACRLRKCYEVGMNKGSQRKERKSSGSVNKSPKRSRSESENGINSTEDNPTPAKNPRKSRTTIIIEALSKADLPSLESYHNHSLPPTRVHLLNSLVKLAERELVLLINWAKNVPGYTELSLGDQVHLIECCWMELLLLNCAFRSMDHGGRQLVFAPDLVLERPFWTTLGMSDILEQISAVSEQLVQYDLHREELLLLQATVLANAEVRKLASYPKLHGIRQSLLDSLVDIAQKYHPDNLRHIPSLLLLLTHVRQAAERATAYFQSVKKEGIVSFCDLLTEMLDAQCDDKKTPTSVSAS